MATPTPDRESIDTFISITGSSELIAVQKLTEHGGGLNEAVNSYFTEGDTNARHETNVDDLMDIDDTHRGINDSHHAETASETVPETRVTRGTNDDASHDTCVSPSAPELSNVPDYGIEDEMIKAAIEASKREAETSRVDVKHEKASGELESEAGPSETRASKLTKAEEPETLASSNGGLCVESSSVEDETEDADEQPLVRHRTRRTNLNTPVGPTVQQNVNNPDEWGGISSVEHNEAVMLEAAMFGGVREAAGYRVPNTRSRARYTRNGLGRARGPYTRLTPRPPSPTLTAQRLIREQQNDEYLASLQADREKELLEQAAREAAIAEEQRKLEQEQETERQLAAKEASLPQEPASDDSNVITLLVRMPDGSRRGRRFMKTDKLQHLFDFMDVGRVVKPNTYRLVRPYPRRAFGDGESELTLNELGLTSKQEALFLELI